MLDEPRNPYDSVLGPTASTPYPASPTNPPSEHPHRVVIHLGDKAHVWESPPSAPPSPAQLRQQHADDRQRERERRAVEQYAQAWEGRLDGLRTDPRLLKRCLDQALMRQLHGPAARLFWRVSRVADALQVSPTAMRAALELVALWPLPPQGPDGSSAPDGLRLFEASVWYAATYDARAVYTAVRGDAKDGRHGRGWKKVPWSVLQPLAAFKGYDDRSIKGDRLAIAYGPPQERTYRALPELREAYTGLLEGLQRVAESVERVYAWSTGAYSAALAEGDASLGHFALDALTHPIRPQATLTLSAVNGTARAAAAPVTAADAGVPFSPNDVGRYLEAAGGRARISAVESSTRATLEVVDPFTTTGPIAAGQWGIERVPREEFQRTANAERDREARRYFKVGDRVLDVPLVQELERELRDRNWIARVGRQVEVLETLAGGSRPALLAQGGGRNVAAYRAIAADVAERINKGIRDPRRRSRVVDGISLDVYDNHGLYRAEVLERTKAILYAVYGVSMTEAEIKAAVQKRRKTKGNLAKK